MMKAKVLFAAQAEGEVMVLDDWLSFGGGLDPESGLISDQSHPQVNCSITGKILVLPGVRGSAGSPSTLAESLRLRTGPGAVILLEAETSSLAAAFVAKELYQIRIPVLLMTKIDYDGMRNGQLVRIEESGSIVRLQN
tara:strand:- start:1865 stop:2278 length:414 start_codon:yes stop_codon:yes gene_type:complete